jgi:hypothetical protein
MALVRRLVALGLLVVLAGCSTGAASPPATTDLSGSFTNTGALGNTGDDPSCTLYAGAPVTITDPTGKVIGSASLGTGATNTGDTACVYMFDAGQVPADETFYGVTIGQKGKVQFSLAELKSDGWNAALTAPG